MVPLSDAVSAVAIRRLHTSNACPRLRKVTPCGWMMQTDTHPTQQAGHCRCIQRRAAAAALHDAAATPSRPPDSSALSGAMVVVVTNR